MNYPVTRDAIDRPAHHGLHDTLPDCEAVGCLPLTEHSFHDCVARGCEPTASTVTADHAAWRAHFGILAELVEGA